MDLTRQGLVFRVLHRARGRSKTRQRWSRCKRKLLSRGVPAAYATSRMSENLVAG